MHEVVQVIPLKRYIIAVYFASGHIKSYDMVDLMDKGIFKSLKEDNNFFDLCTVLNHTAAWDIGGNFDERQCIDLDPNVLFNEGLDIEDPLLAFA